MTEDDEESVDPFAAITMFVIGRTPIRMVGQSESMVLPQLPLQLHLESAPGRPWAVSVPTGTAEGDVTLLCRTGRLDISVTEEGLAVVLPTNDRALIPGRFYIGDDFTVRPLAIAPPIPSTCQHGISPISLCPLTPP